MRPTHLRRGALAIALLMGLPSAASACVLDVSHFFVPWPPCLADAGKLAVRIDGRNAQILGDVVLTLKMVNSVKREVRMWQAATSEVMAIEGRLRRVYGDMRVSPMASLAVAYQRTAMGSYVSISSDGKVGVSEQITDAIADSRARLGAFADGSRMNSALGGTLMRGRRDAGSVAANQLFMADNTLRAMVDYRKQVDLLTDSVFMEASQRASRYAGAKDPEGYVEGVLSMSEAAITSARVAAMSSQSRSIPGRRAAVEYLGLAEEHAKRAQTIVKHSQ